MTEGTEAEIVLDLDTGEPLDLEGWEQSGSIAYHDDAGNLWENRSYQRDLGGDGLYEVITGKVLLEPAPAPATD